MHSGPKFFRSFSLLKLINLSSVSESILLSEEVTHKLIMVADDFSLIVNGVRVLAESDELETHLSSYLTYRND